MALTVSMTLKLEIVKGVRSLKSCRLLKVLIIVIRAQSHSVEAPLPPWFWGWRSLVSIWEKVDRLPRPCSPSEAYLRLLTPLTISKF